MAATAIFKKTKLVVTGGLFRLLASFGGVLISFAAIRLQSPALWGEVVTYAIMMDLAFSVVGWGAGPYLLREFSLAPKNKVEAWSRATASRSMLLAGWLLWIGFL